MTSLTDDLEFDETLPYEHQTWEVKKFVSAVMSSKKPDLVDSESCGGELTRPTKRVWHLPGAEILELPQYKQSPLSAACFATSAIIIILRNRLI